VAETLPPGEGDHFRVNEDAVGYAWMGGVIVCRLTGGNVPGCDGGWRA